MWKKIGLGFVVLVSALIVFVHVQLSSAEKKMAQLLKRHDIQVDELNVGFFPPALEVQHLTFSHSDLLLQAKKADVAFNPVWLAMGKLEIAAIHLTDGAVSMGTDKQTPPDYQAINLSLQPTALYSDDLPALFDFIKNNRLSDELAERLGAKILFNAQNTQHDQIELLLDFRLAADRIDFSQGEIRIKPAQAVYQSQQEFDLIIQKGMLAKISDKPEDGYEILADNLTLNGESFGYLNGQFMLPSDKRKSYLLNLVSDACNSCKTRIELEKYTAAQRKFTFHTADFPLEKLLQAFRLPVFASGKGEVEAMLELNGLLPEKGEFFIDSLNGKIHGLSILQLIGRYLPINYNTDNEMNTAYEHFTTRFGWNKDYLKIDEIHLQSKELLIKGKGKIELNEMQCDINLSVGVNDPKYDKLRLPLRFFDNCYSPQYKIDIDKGFRDSLRNYIKQKINE